MSTAGAPSTAQRTVFSLGRHGPHRPLRQHTPRRAVLEPGAPQSPGAISNPCGDTNYTTLSIRHACMQAETPGSPPQDLPLPPQQRLGGTGESRLGLPAATRGIAGQAGERLHP